MLALLVSILSCLFLIFTSFPFTSPFVLHSSFYLLSSLYHALHPLLPPPPPPPSSHYPFTPWCITNITSGLNIGAHKEAAEHLLSGLDHQLQVSSSTSDQLWTTLRRCLISMVRLLPFHFFSFPCVPTRFLHMTIHFFCSIPVPPSVISLVVLAVQY